MASETERQQALNKAYGAASQQLREKYRDEFNDLYRKAAAELGIEWTPKPTAQEKAMSEVETLLSEHPDLAAVIAVKAAGIAHEAGMQVAVEIGDAPEPTA